MGNTHQKESDTALVTFVVVNARAVSSKTLFALVDVEMQIAGVSFTLLGVQARKVSNVGTSVHLPTCKNTDGVWRPAIQLPDELRGPLFDAVLTFLVDEGLACRRNAPSTVLDVHGLHNQIAAVAR